MEWSWAEVRGGAGEESVMDQWMKPRVEPGWTLTSQMSDSDFCALSLAQPLCPSAVLPVDLCPSPHIKGSRLGDGGQEPLRGAKPPNSVSQGPLCAPALTNGGTCVSSFGGDPQKGHLGSPGSEPSEVTWYRAPTKSRRSWSHLRVPQVTTQGPGQDCPPCHGPYRPEIFVYLLINLK